MKQPRILYLAHRIPYPPNKGDKIRSFNEIKYLSTDFDIHIACLVDEPEDMKYRKDLKEYCSRVEAFPLSKRLAKGVGLVSLARGRSISEGYFYLKRMQKTVNRWISEHAYEAVVCFSSPMAEYLFRNPDLFPPEGKKTNHNPRLIMDFCDLDSDKWRMYAQESPFPFNHVFHLEFERLLAYEKKINRCFDHSIFVSQQEADLFRKYYPEARKVSVIRNGVDFEFFSSAGPELPEKKNGPVLMFAGAMDYHANVDGVVWFCEKILPEIRKKLPDTRFLIVGSNPAPEVEKLARPDQVIVTGFVDDIRPYYRSADVCVIPLRIARGVQNKVLEAMSMEKPVVSTSTAVKGLQPLPDNRLLVADTPGEIVSGVLSVIETPELGKTLGENARDFIQTNFRWRKNIDILKMLITG